MINGLLSCLLGACCKQQIAAAVVEPRLNSTMLLPTDFDSFHLNGRDTAEPRD